MEKPVRQFKGMRKKKTEYYDHKVTHTKTTRILCLGKVIPAGWAFVRVTILDRQKDTVTVQFKKLLGVNNNAHSIKADKTSQQDA